MQKILCTIINHRQGALVWFTPDTIVTFQAMTNGDFSDVLYSSFMVQYFVIGNPPQNLHYTICQRSLIF